MEEALKVKNSKNHHNRKDRERSPRQSKYSFFYWLHKGDSNLSVKFKKRSITINDVVCEVPFETRWNQKYRRIECYGVAGAVQIINNKAYIK